MAASCIEQALYTYLTTTGSSTVTTAIGKRLYLAKATAGATYPYVVYQTISDPHKPFAFGAPNSGQARVQFSVYHTSRTSAIDVAHRIRKRLRHYSGAMDSMTIHKMDVTGTVLLPDPDKDVFQATFDALPIYIDAS
jgi:hypothetical protein